MKVCNVWIFNVGRGLASAIKTPNGKWMMFDLGSSSEFCPVESFMLDKLKTAPIKNDKKSISQLVISHPHDDHMLSIKEFDKNIYPELLTVPNDNDGQLDKYKVEWDRIDNQRQDLTKYLRDKMLPGRQPPLKAASDDGSDGFVFKIYYLPPGDCINNDNLLNGNYPNNISIMARLNYKGNVILFGGDMMKDGMDELIDKDTNFKNDLQKYGVDFYITPHHGLRSSFSTTVFSSMRGGKSGLNIISERPTSGDSNHIVDERYGSEDYSTGHIVHFNGKRELKRKIRSSVVGHIRISLFEDKKTLVVCGDDCLKF